MLKSVLFAMPTYIMTFFHLHSSLYKRIQSALTRFWLDGNTEKKENELDFLEENDKIF